MARAGLRVSGSWLAVPPREPRTLLPLTSVTAADRALLAASALQGRLASLLARCSASILEETAPEVGLLVQRTDALPPRVARRSCRRTPGCRDDGLGGSRGLRRAPRDGNDSQVNGSRNQARPAARGRRLKDSRPHGQGGRGQNPLGSLLRTGRIAHCTHADRRAREARLGSLARATRGAAGLLESVVAWLAKWHLKSRRTRTFSERDVEQLVIAPANALAAEIPGFSGYLERLGCLPGTPRQGSSVCGCTQRPD